MEKREGNAINYTKLSFTRKFAMSEIRFAFILHKKTPMLDTGVAGLKGHLFSIILPTD